MPLTPKELTEAKLRCVRIANEAVDYASKHFGIVIDYPQVRFGIKGMNGGTANWHENIIQLNPFLLAHNPEEYFRQVVKHEVCHLLNREANPKAKAHGQEWKNLMRRFGLRPDRCHSMNVSVVPTQRNRIHVPTRSRMLINNNKIITVAGGKIMDFD